MLLQEALKLLKEGKNISRCSWKKEDGYLVLMKGMIYVWKILVSPPNAGSHIFSYEELIADDWKEYDENEFLEKKDDMQE